MAINWRTLEELHTDVEAQDKVMDEAVEIVYGLEKYADENEHLRDEIERHLSDILVSGSAQIELRKYLIWILSNLISDM